MIYQHFVNDLYELWIIWSPNITAHSTNENNDQDIRERSEDENQDDKWNPPLTTMSLSDGNIVFILKLKLNRRILDIKK